jgi:hypothetical protein
MARSSSGYLTSACNRWVTFWVTQTSHRAKALMAEEFNAEVRALSPAYKCHDMMVVNGLRIRR